MAADEVAASEWSLGRLDWHRQQEQHKDWLPVADNPVAPRVAAPWALELPQWPAILPRPY